MFKVHRGVEGNLPILHLIDQHVHAKEMLEFMIGTGLVGHRLVEWFVVECNSEPIKLYGKLSKAILKMNTAPKLLIGVNFK